MGFRKDGFATVWQVKQGNGNYTDVRISTSKKNKQTDQYETDFSGFVRFAGDAHKNASGLKEKDRIKLGDCDVTNSYSKEKNVTYTNYVVFNFEMADGSTPKKNNDTGFQNIPADIDECLPFN